MVNLRMRLFVNALEEHQPAVVRGNSEGEMTVRKEIPGLGEPFDLEITCLIQGVGFRKEE